MSFMPKRESLNQRRVTRNSSSTEFKPILASGVRPSPLDGRLTTSTGTRTLDSLLAGHGGLALGSMLLVGETGTTDFSGYLLKYYAAEGIAQGHQVHVLGVNENWGRELPGIIAKTNTPDLSSKPVSSGRMKIAWRYERLGQFGAEASDRLVDQQNNNTAPTFCHDFDLSRRLTLSHSDIKFTPVSNFMESKNETSPFSSFISELFSQLQNSPTVTIHRVVVPNILSPINYPFGLCNPSSILQFFHALRALLRKYRSQLTAIITLPLTMYPRNTGLTRWIELISDGVLELVPFPTTNNTNSYQRTGPVQEETPQGILKIHKLPVFHEKGGGGTASLLSGFGDNTAFTLNRRKGLVFKPYSLPPVESNIEPNQDTSEKEKGKLLENDIQF